MASDSEEDEFSPPDRSLSTQVAVVIERICVAGAWMSIPLFLPIGGLFIGYLLGGYALIGLELWSPTYEFLSLTGDIYFAWLGFLTGLVICFGTRSLIWLAFLTEGEGQIHNEVCILSSFIGFGFGAGVMRITFATVLGTVV